jgi:hypothetical protein
MESFDQDRVVVGPVAFDRVDGYGECPDSRNILHKGLTCAMPLGVFTRLAPPLPPEFVSEEAIQEIAVAISSGRGLSPPFLDVDLVGDGEPRVLSHEGRHRALVVSRMLDLSVEIPVQFFFRGGLRARDISDDDVARMRQGMWAHRRGRQEFVPGPVFSTAWLAGRAVSCDAVASLTLG